MFGRPPINIKSQHSGGLSALVSANSATSEDVRNRCTDQELMGVASLSEISKSVFPIQSTGHFRF